MLSLTGNLNKISQGKEKCYVRE